MPFDILVAASTGLRESALPLLECESRGVLDAPRPPAEQLRGILQGGGKPNAAPLRLTQALTHARPLTSDRLMQTLASLRASRPQDLLHLSVALRADVTRTLLAPLGGEPEESVDLRIEDARRRGFRHGGFVRRGFVHGSTPSARRASQARSGGSCWRRRSAMTRMSGGNACRAACSAASGRSAASSAVRRMTSASCCAVAKQLSMLSDVASRMRAPVNPQPRLVSSSAM